MTSITDLFAADLADLKRRSDETDRKMADSIARMHASLAEMKRANDDLMAALID